MMWSAGPLTSCRAAGTQSAWGLSLGPVSAQRQIFFSFNRFLPCRCVLVLSIHGRPAECEMGEKSNTVSQTDSHCETSDDDDERHVASSLLSSSNHTKHLNSLITCCIIIARINIGTFVFADRGCAETCFLRCSFTFL